MAAPFTVTPVLGVDLNNPDLVANITEGTQDAPQLGTQVFGSNGRRYVYAQANATIPSATAVCTVNATTFLVTASGGSYLAPTVSTSLVAGDRAWFSAASV